MSWNFLGKKNKFLTQLTMKLFFGNLLPNFLKKKKKGGGGA